MMAAEALQAMTLDQLLGFDVPALPVSGIQLDSRRIVAGDVFLAVPGGARHGLEFAEAASGRGASAVVCDPAGSDIPELSIPVITVDGLRGELGVIADRFFASPSASLDVIGVTGTNGKTTVSWLLTEALQLLGRRAGYSGTLGHGVSGVSSMDGMTTPDVVESHRRLADMKAGGADAAAIEVSSHALDQGRVSGVRFKVVIFTNLGRDHLDYHETMEAYEAAKARLFSEYDAEHRVINTDTPAGARIAASCGHPVITVSMQPDADASVVIRNTEAGPDGFELAFDSVWGAGVIQLPLLGLFNVENAVSVLAALLAMGVAPADAARVLGQVSAPPGRLERVPGNGASVVIDYAHTPDALDAALSAVRVNCAGKLWCVFGCGGDRDTGKRPQMAAVAERLADRVIVTSDNPRGEAPEAIIDDIFDGFSAGYRADRIEDRAAAIRAAVTGADDNDLVLVAGKGHEREQIIGDLHIPFSDRDVALSARDAAGASS